MRDFDKQMEMVLYHSDEGDVSVDAFMMIRWMKAAIIITVILMIISRIRSEWRISYTTMMFW